MKYIIPKEISTEIKFSKSIYLKDFLISIIALMVSVVFSSMVYEPIVPFYYVFVVIGTLILLSKSRANPQKRLYESIYYSLKKDSIAYRRL
ncbi:MAG: DUF5592 family protein [Clostridium sp.]